MHSNLYLVKPFFFSNCYLVVTQKALVRVSHANLCFFPSFLEKGKFVSFHIRYGVLALQISCISACWRYISCLWPFRGIWSAFIIRGKPIWFGCLLETKNPILVVGLCYAKLGWLENIFRFHHFSEFFWTGLICTYI